MMRKLGRAAIKKIVQDRLAELAAGPPRTATRQRLWRLKRCTALELIAIGRPLHLTPSDISHRGGGSYGADIMFSPLAWEIYGRLWIGCACHPTNLDVEGIFRNHDERSRPVQVTQRAVPLIVHRCDHHSTSGTMRQTD